MLGIIWPWANFRKKKINFLAKWSQEAYVSIKQLKGSCWLAVSGFNNLKMINLILNHPDPLMQQTARREIQFFLRNFLFGRLRDGISGTLQWNFNYQKFGTVIDFTALLSQCTLSSRDSTSHPALSSSSYSLELASLQSALFCNCWERKQSFAIDKDLVVAFSVQLYWPSCSHKERDLCSSDFEGWLLSGEPSAVWNEIYSTLAILTEDYHCIHPCSPLHRKAVGQLVQ